MINTTTKDTLLAFEPFDWEKEQRSITFRQRLNADGQKTSTASAVRQVTLPVSSNSHTSVFKGPVDDTANQGVTLVDDDGYPYELERPEYMARGITAPTLSLR